jgi:ferric-dicitrate binding protein FerR (iron transport regulator)
MNEKTKLSLFCKYLNKQLTKEEYEKFVKELGDKGVHENFDYLFDGFINMLSKKYKDIEHVEDLNTEVQRVLNIAKQKERTVNKQTKSRNIYSNLAKIAAVVIFLVSLTITWYSINNKYKDNGLQIDETVNVLTKNTGYGEMSNVTLSDGSNVKMNAGSKICFNEVFSGKTREVNLNGQAFFDVAKNKEKPFVIKAGKVKVTVLGTAFDVKSYDDDEYACITVLRGRVKVNSPTTEYVITPNEQVIFFKSTGELVKREVNAENFLKWLQQKLYFEKTPVPEMLHQLERWYNVKFKVNDPEILSKTVTGEYVNNNLKSVLNAFCFSINIEYKINNNVVTLSKIGK